MRRATKAPGAKPKGRPDPYDYKYSKGATKNSKTKTVSPPKARNSSAKRSPISSKPILPKQHQKARRESEKPSRVSPAKQHENNVVREFELFMKQGEFAERRIAIIQKYYMKRWRVRLNTIKILNRRSNHIVSTKPTQKITEKSRSTSSKDSQPKATRLSHRVESAKPTYTSSKPVISSNKQQTRSKAHEKQTLKVTPEEQYRRDKILHAAQRFMEFRQEPEKTKEGPAKKNIPTFMQDSSPIKNTEEKPNRLQVVPIPRSQQQEPAEVKPQIRQKQPDPIRRTRPKPMPLEPSSSSEEELIKFTNEMLRRGRAGREAQKLSELDDSYSDVDIPKKKVSPPPKSFDLMDIDDSDDDYVLTKPISPKRKHESSSESDIDAPTTKLPPKRPSPIKSFDLSDSDDAENYLPPKRTAPKPLPQSSSPKEAPKISPIKETSPARRSPKKFDPDSDSDEEIASLIESINKTTQSGRARSDRFAVKLKEEEFGYPTPSKDDTLRLSPKKKDQKSSYSDNSSFEFDNPKKPSPKQYTHLLSDSSDEDAKPIKTEKPLLTPTMRNSPLPKKSLFDLSDSDESDIDMNFPPKPSPKITTDINLSESEDEIQKAVAAARKKQSSSPQHKTVINMDDSSSKEDIDEYIRSHREKIDASTPVKTTQKVITTPLATINDGDSDLDNFEFKPKSPSKHELSSSSSADDFIAKIHAQRTTKVNLSESGSEKYQSPKKEAVPPPSTTQVKLSSSNSDDDFPSFKREENIRTAPSQKKTEIDLSAESSSDIDTGFTPKIETNTQLNLDDESSNDIDKKPDIVEQPKAAEPKRTEFNFSDESSSDIDFNFTQKATEQKKPEADLKIGDESSSDIDLDFMKKKEPTQAETKINLSDESSDDIDTGFTAKQTQPEEKKPSYNLSDEDSSDIDTGFEKAQQEQKKPSINLSDESSSDLDITQQKDKFNLSGENSIEIDAKPKNDTKMDKESSSDIDFDFNETKKKPISSSSDSEGDKQIMKSTQLTTQTNLSDSGDAKPRKLTEPSISTNLSEDDYTFKPSPMKPQINLSDSDDMESYKPLPKAQIDEESSSDIDAEEAKPQTEEPKRQQFNLSDDSDDIMAEFRSITSKPVTIEEKPKIEEQKKSSTSESEEEKDVIETPRVDSPQPNPNYLDESSDDDIDAFIRSARQTVAEAKTAFSDHFSSKEEDSLVEDKKVPVEEPLFSSSSESEDEKKQEVKTTEKASSGNEKISSESDDDLDFLKDFKKATPPNASEPVQETEKKDISLSSSDDEIDTFLRKEKSNEAVPVQPTQENADVSISESDDEEFLKQIKKEMKAPLKQQEDELESSDMDFEFNMENKSEEPLVESPKNEEPVEEKSPVMNSDSDSDFDFKDFVSKMKVSDTKEKAENEGEKKSLSSEEDDSDYLAEPRQNIPKSEATVQEIKETDSEDEHNPLPEKKDVADYSTLELEEESDSEFDLANIRKEFGNKKLSSDSESDIDMEFTKKEDEAPKANSEPVKEESNPESDSDFDFLKNKDDKSAPEEKISQNENEKDNEDKLESESDSIDDFIARGKQSITTTSKQLEDDSDSDSDFDFIAKIREEAATASEEPLKPKNILPEEKPEGLTSGDEDLVEKKEEPKMKISTSSSDDGLDEFLKLRAQQGPTTIDAIEDDSEGDEDIDDLISIKPTQKTAEEKNSDSESPKPYNPETIANIGSDSDELEEEDSDNEFFSKIEQSYNNNNKTSSDAHSEDDEFNRPEINSLIDKYNQDPQSKTAPIRLPSDDSDDEPILRKSAPVNDDEIARPNPNFMKAQRIAPIQGLIEEEEEIAEEDDSDFAIEAPPTPGRVQYGTKTSPSAEGHIKLPPKLNASGSTHSSKDEDDDDMKIDFKDINIDDDDDEADDTEQFIASLRAGTLKDQTMDDYDLEEEDDIDSHLLSNIDAAADAFKDNEDLLSPQKRPSGPVPTTPAGPTSPKGFDEDDDDLSLGDDEDDEAFFAELRRKHPDVNLSDSDESD